MPSEDWFVPNHRHEPGGYPLTLPPQKKPAREHSQAETVVSIDVPDVTQAEHAMSTPRTPRRVQVDQQQALRPPTSPLTPAPQKPLEHPSQQVHDSQATVSHVWQPLFTQDPIIPRSSQLHPRRAPQDLANRRPTQLPAGSRRRKWKITKADVQRLRKRQTSLSKLEAVFADAQRAIAGFREARRSRWG